MTTTTRRGTLAALAALPALLVSARPAAARPVVTRWHQLQQRATELASWRAFRASVGAATRAELTHQLDALTELVADLTDQLVATHTEDEPR